MAFRERQLKIGTTAGTPPGLTLSAHRWLLLALKTDNRRATHKRKPTNTNDFWSGP